MHQIRYTLKGEYLDSIDKILQKVQDGFRTINVPEAQKEAALNWLRQWLTQDIFSVYVPQITYLIEQQEWTFLMDSFYQIIPFGTGGRRGMVGIGPNRINIWTVQSSAQGHSQYLLKKYGETAKKKGVVLAYDVRCFSDTTIYNTSIPNPVLNLDGKALAIAAAEVYAANGISVYLFESFRSTPELSFAIRHLGTIAGALFSASHNLPSDNGKKVYDNHGGQLIPPDDQILVDEVTSDMTVIKKTPYDQAIKDGLIKRIGDQIDLAYCSAVSQVSLSKTRTATIAYSPLHGTGMTSVFPILKNLGFNVILDPKTKNMSGRFENITYNIPNPEVEASFDTVVPFAKSISADIIINTDPDADRIGLMVKEKEGWRFINGNEIGILLTQYVITKYQANKLLDSEKIVIKTIVTTSLIEKIAKDNNIKCISNLLVGFKYIANEMNLLEKNNQIDNFLLGTEESHGYIVGNYCRDKDAACAAVWISELASDLKDQKMTLCSYLDEIYAQYGYCENYLTEIRLLGAMGMDQILKIMSHLRESDIKSFGKYNVLQKIDFWDGEPQPHLSITDTISRNVLTYKIVDSKEILDIKITIRPSGTEPKLKMYFEILNRPCNINALPEIKTITNKLMRDLEKDFMNYCYQVLGYDFPDRGFLLFWQIPLSDKLKYFKIENDIIELKKIADKEERKKSLNNLLRFLGSNPITKVDRAFQDKYQIGILEYLDI